MEAQKMLDLLIANLPTILSVLAALGLWKMGAELIRGITAQARKMAAGTKTKLDDVVVGVVAERLDEIADLLEHGNLSEARRKIGIVKLQAKPFKAGPVVVK